MVHVHNTPTRLINWEEFHRDAKNLAQRLLALGPWTGVVALTRGGLVPTAIIARELDIRAVDTLCISSYAGQVQKDIEIIKKPVSIGASGGQGWLIIDDLVDTGITAQAARAILPHAHFAAVYAKPNGLGYVDVYANDIEQHVWIFFPWDIEP